MKHAILALAVCWLASAASLGGEMPQSVDALWADFDPRAEDLETEVVRSWTSEGLALRCVRFRIGMFRGRVARMAAFYGFPENAHGKLPAVMHIHGGGQRARLDEVRALAARGYAALSVNWGGREMEDARPGDPNTDWGVVDPTQTNAPRYFSLLPGPKQFFTDRAHPKNCNWYLLTLGCRRGLTFLERQPEVDPQRLGVHGYSMGGNLTMYVAGSDRRVKVAVPGVGGQGWRWQTHAFGAGVTQQDWIQGDVELFRRTLSYESYAPRIGCPLLHRSATNDFHGWMDDVYRTDALIRDQPVRHAWSPHYNHRLTPEVAVGLFLWLDQFLKGGPALPDTPASELTLKTDDGVPRLRVTPRSAWPVARCDVYYSVDDDPRARFWRSAAVSRAGSGYIGRLPLEGTRRPLFAFANVCFTLPHPESIGQLPELRSAPIREVCLSSLLHKAEPAALAAAGVRAELRPNPLIEDFAHGWRDWYRHNVGNHEHWQNWTRKITDPLWRGPDGAKLAITLQVDQPNRLCVVAIENEWRSYRGPKRVFVCTKEIPGAATDQVLLLAADDFQSTTDGKPLGSWRELDALGLCAYYQEKGQPSPPPRWNGPPPVFKRLQWR